MLQFYSLQNVLQHPLLLLPTCPNLSPTLMKTIKLCFLSLKMNSLHPLQVPEKALSLNLNGNWLGSRQNRYLIIIKLTGIKHPPPKRICLYPLARLTWRLPRFYMIMPFPNWMKDFVRIARKKKMSKPDLPMLKEAIKGAEADEWKKAMKVEYNVVISNGT